MSFSIVFSNVTMLIIFASVGFILAKANLAKPQHGQILSSLLVYVFSPAMLFQTFATKFNVPYIKANYSIMLFSLAIMAVLIVISVIVPRFLTKHPYKRKVYEYSMLIANYGYMGYPLTEALFGKDVLINVMMFALPLSVYIYTYGLCRLTNTGLNLKKLINPSILAILFGMIYGLSGLSMPAFLDNLLTTAKAPMGIVAMLLAGITVSEYKFSELLRYKANYFVAIWKVLILPLAIGFILTTVLNRPELARVALMIYAIPCGLNTIVFPKLVGEDCSTGASLALISSLLSIGTIPLCLYLFT
ncbi:MAG: AEC family transporter [Clostridia bacterium]|nr:AEC family transporter [Clostridia bacterium]